jgi:hypothetical protein
VIAQGTVRGDCQLKGGTGLARQAESSSQGLGPRDGPQQGVMRPRTERVADGTVVLRRITHPVRGRSRMLASRTATREAGA